MKKIILLLLINFGFLNAQTDSVYYKEAINFLSSNSDFKESINFLLSKKEAKLFTFNDSIFNNNNGTTNDLPIKFYKNPLLLMKKFNEEDFALLDTIKTTFQSKNLWNSKNGKIIHNGLTFYFGEISGGFLVISFRYTVGPYYGMRCTKSKSNKVLIFLKFDETKKVSKCVIDKYKNTDFCRVLD